MTWRTRKDEELAVLGAQERGEAHGGEEVFVGDVFVSPCFDAAEERGHVLRGLETGGGGVVMGEPERARGGGLEARPFDVLVDVEGAGGFGAAGEDGAGLLFDDGEGIERGVDVLEGVGLLAHGAHRYQVPALGLPIRDSAGVLTRYHAARLTQRAPTRTDPYRLALEDTEPLHPLCIGYDVLTARALIKSTFKKVRPALIIGADQSDGQAIIDIDYQGHVGEAVCRHLQCAPSALD